MSFGELSFPVNASFVVSRIIIVVQGGHEKRNIPRAAQNCKFEKGRISTADDAGAKR
jgi:hypothetical protein